MLVSVTSFSNGNAIDRSFEANSSFDRPAMIHAAVEEHQVGDRLQPLVAAAAAFAGDAVLRRVGQLGLGERHVLQCDELELALSGRLAQ